VDKEIRLLVLDDEENILLSLKRLFISESFGVFTTTDYQEALKVLDKEEIKVVISDQRMPYIQGVEFLEQVKAKQPDIIRILLTGYTDIQAAQDAINVGEVYRFINKPWNGEELKGAIRQAIEHYDLVVENKKYFEEMNAKNEELEILNRKLKNLYEAQKEFTETVSHELRTPLASIKATVELVLNENLGKINEGQAKFLNKTKNNVDRLNRLINDILDITQMETGQLELNFEFYDIGRVINEEIEIQESVAKEKGLFIKAEISSDLRKIPIDVDKMHQVFSNLINNAIKFTESGGITISCMSHEDKNHIEICVQDTGPGIKKGDMNKLFRKFEQVGDPTKQVGGTGLGLAICKEIIRRHGGKLWAESKVGQGTSFKFVLPIQERRTE